ncbi:MAG: hypothetical protein QM756_24605 [Polyangiaceae bacterium]
MRRSTDSAASFGHCPPSRTSTREPSLRSNSASSAPPAASAALAASGERKCSALQGEELVTEALDGVALHARARFVEPRGPGAAVHRRGVPGVAKRKTSELRNGEREQGARAQIVDRRQQRLQRRILHQPDARFALRFANLDVAVVTGGTRCLAERDAELRVTKVERESCARRVEPERLAIDFAGLEAACKARDLERTQQALARLRIGGAQPLQSK